MAEYIDRNAFIRRYRELYCTDCDRRKGMKKGKLTTIYEIGGPPCRACRMDDVLCDLEDYPTADVVDVRHGRWKDAGDFISCSLCHATRLKEFESDYGKAIRLDARTNYCPDCGAKMDGEEAD